MNDREIIGDRQWQRAASVRKVTHIGSVVFLLSAAASVVGVAVSPTNLAIADSYDGGEASTASTLSSNVSGSASYGTLVTFNASLAPSSGFSSSITGTADFTIAGTTANQLILQGGNTVIHTR